jgi:hypothetical protein
MAARYYPGTPEFKALKTNVERHAALQECLEFEKARHPRSPKRIRLIEGATKHFLMEACKEDPYFDFAQHFWLPDKGGRRVRFRLKPAQKVLADYYYSSLNNRNEYHPYGKPVRVLVPKSRQHGISHGVAGIYYRHCRTYGNQMAYILAQHDGPARQIFRKYQYFHKFDRFRPKPQSDSKRELIFEHNGSGIIVDTAGVQETSFAHGFTFQLAHFSETSRYRTQNVGSMFSDFFQTVPNEMESFSSMIVESTGNGMDNLFAAWCNEVAKFDETAEMIEELVEEMEMATDVEWDLLFFPWMDRWDTRIPFRSNKERDKFEASLTDDERRFLNGIPQHDGVVKKAELEQVKWYRRTLQEMRGETGEALTPEEKKRKMKQQHPSTLEESFTSSGVSAFDLDALDDIQLRAREAQPKFNNGKGPWRGRLILDWSDEDAHTDEETYLIGKSDFVADSDYDWVIYEWPHPDHSYVSGWDFSEGSGSDEADYTVGSIRCQHCRHMAARFRRRGPRSEPHRVLGEMRVASLFWNDAILNPETNSAPALPMWLAKTDRADFLAIRRRQPDTTITDGAQEQYGFRTGLNKALLVNEHRRSMAQEPDSYNDLELISEMRKFRKERVESSGAWKYPGATGKGQHDDIVIADALARMADRENPTYDTLADKVEEDALQKFPRLTGDKLLEWQKKFEEEGLDPATEPWEMLDGD